MNNEIGTIETREQIATGVEESIGSPTHGIETSSTQSALMGIVLEMIEDGEIELHSLVERLNQTGLRDRAKSWIGVGENETITAREVEITLGAKNLKSIAAKAGLPEVEVAEELAITLPTIIDKFSPGGEMPEEAVMQEAASLVKTKIA